MASQLPPKVLLTKVKERELLSSLMWLQPPNRVTSIRALKAPQQKWRCWVLCLINTSLLYQDD